MCRVQLATTCKGASVLSVLLYDAVLLVWRADDWPLFSPKEMSNTQWLLSAATVDLRFLWFEALAGTVVARLAVNDQLVVMHRPAVTDQEQ